MKQNIKNTFKKRLFLNPSPIRKAQYTKHLETIFPGSQMFIQFLEESNHQESIRLAKKILLRLIFESKCAPPTKLLFNLLDYENKKMDSNDAHQTREHFIHLVNLYMLGVYFFLYNPILFENNSRLFRQFRFRESRSDRKSSANLTEKSMLDFAEAFKLFILYHDVNYPIEGYLGTNSSRKEKELYLGAYRSNHKGQNKIFNYQAKDIALKSLVKLIILNLQLRNNDNSTSLNSYLRHYEEDLNLVDTNILEKSVRMNEIHSVYGRDSLTNLLPVLEQTEFVAVYINDLNFEPQLCLHYDHNDNLTSYPREFNKYGLKHRNAKYIYDEFCKKNVPLSRDGRWVYFTYDGKEAFHNYFANSYLQIKRKWAGANAFAKSAHIDLTSENCSLFDQLVDNLQLKFNSITSENDYKDFTFEVFELLFNSFDLTGSDPDEMTRLDVFKKISGPVLVNFKATLRDALADSFKKNIEDYLNDEENARIDKINSWIENGSYTELTEDLLNILKLKEDKENAISASISDRITEDIKNKIQQQVQLFNIWTDIKNCFEKDFESSFSIDLESEKISPTRELNETFSEYEHLFSNKNFFNGYRPSFAKGESFYDHGIVSALMMNELKGFWDNLKSLKDISPKYLLLSTAGVFDLTNNKSSDYNFNTIYNQAMISTLLHNLYPKYLEDKSYRTSVVNAPFQFLCILADSLQPWDRKRLVNEAKNKLNYSTKGSGFNIELNRNLIYITEEGYDLDFEEKGKVYRAYLDDYMEDISHLIKLEFREK